MQTLSECSLTVQLTLRSERPFPIANFGPQFNKWLVSGCLKYDSISLAELPYCSGIPSRHPCSVVSRSVRIGEALVLNLIESACNPINRAVACLCGDSRALHQPYDGPASSFVQV